MRKNIFLVLACLFTMQAFSQPTIGSFTPSSGPVGTVVTISGTNFSDNASENIVHIGAVTAVVSAATANSLTVTIPNGTNYQPITVTTNNLTAYSAHPFIVTFDGGGLILSNSFATAVNFTTGNYPLSICLNDFDGDGKEDMGVVNNFPYDSTVSVLRNNGTDGDITAASFADTVNYVTSDFPFGVSSGDIDGDGKPEMAVVNNGSNTVTVYRNTSTAGIISFKRGGEFITGSGPRSVSIGDIDGDGKPDLVVINDYDNTVSILRNTSIAADISFDSKIDFATGGSPWSVAIGDLDEDGKPDLAVTNSFGFSVSVLRNTSSAGVVSFDAKTDFPTGGGGILALGDLDGDGYTDIATVSYFSGVLSILRNTGTAGPISFDPRIDYTTEAQPSSIAIGDLDGDGKPDIAISNFKSNTVSVFRNNGTAGTVSYEAKVDFPVGTSPSCIAIGDLDQDGKPDLAVTNKASETISVLKNLMGPALPVKLLDFSGKPAGNKTQLQWQTVNEQRTASFIVEYATDGINFSPVTTVNAKGGSSKNSYAFTHLYPQKGINYYRLKIIDADAKSAYSRIIQVQMNNTAALNLYPNPAKSFVIAEHPGTSNTAQLKLVDIMGRMVKLITVTRDAVQTRIDINGIAPGIYKMIWSDGKNIQSKTLAIQ